MAQAPGLGELKRLGKNINGYRGETIEIASVLEDCVAAARAGGWEIKELSAHPKPSILALTRRAGRNGWEHLPNGSSTHVTPSSPLSAGASSRMPRVYLSTGIHGDEPAGPLAIRRLLQENRWPAGIDLWLCPCLNPTGFLEKRRENADGVDLNRHYLHPKAEETIAHISWLQRQPEFDVCLCLHEDWESHGFYLYEQNLDNRPSLAEAVIEGVSVACPIDRSDTIEGRPASNGIIRPNIDPRTRTDWPEAFYLVTHKSRLTYTLEAPSDFPLAPRVASLVVAVNTALGRLAEAWGRKSMTS